MSIAPPIDSQSPPALRKEPGEAAEEHVSLARSAGIIAFGNVASRVLGLVRETAIAYYFGATGLVSAFQAASTIPTMIYDLLIGGMLSAALVPVFSDYARPERRRELRGAAGAMLTLIGLLVAVLVLLIEIFAEPVARLVAGGFSEELLAVTVDLLRIMTPAVWFFAVSGIVTAILYALKRFTFPAFGAAVYNLGIIIVALFFHEQLGISALALGVLLGSLFQLVIQLPDLLRAQVGLRLALRHPALRRIWLLYLPILLGLLVSQAQVIIDRNLASRTGEQSLAWMRDATTLFQMPHGLVAVAISLAALPSLAQFFASGDEAGYCQTLGRGLRAVLVLIVPATAGLWLLATPIVQVIFQRGNFMPSDTEWVVLALNLYLIGLIPASVDWLLNYAFYARNDTLTPALVGVLSVGIYLIAALSLLRPLGFLGLVLADSAKHTGHAIIMLILLRRRLGGLQSLQGGTTLAKTAAAAGVMVIVLFGLMALLKPLLPGGQLGNLIIVSLSALAGGLVYAVAVTILGVEELQLLFDRLLRRFRNTASH